MLQKYDKYLILQKILNVYSNFIFTPSTEQSTKILSKLSLTLPPKYLVSIFSEILVC